jgi:hypothetical protein
MRARRFWRPPLWKWIVVLVLLAATAVLVRWKPAARPVKIELLPFTDSFPAWDGSYPRGRNFPDFGIRSSRPQEFYLAH